jgi:two-component system chemotaxis sensor kinase CheA
LTHECPFGEKMIPRLSPRALLVLVAVLGTSFVGIVLVPGFKLASELVDNTVALKWVGEQQRYPALLRASLDAMRDRLNSRGYIQQSVDDLRKVTANLDRAFLAVSADQRGNWFALTPHSGALAGSVAGGHAATLRDLWSQEQVALKPLLEFKGVPYQDNEATGTVLNESGRQLDRDLSAAIRASRRSLPLLDQELGVAGDELQSATAKSAGQLRLVMFAGLTIAGLLVLLVTVLLGARKRQDASLREARQQTVDILRTVKDGLFLIDENLIIGAAYSAALETMFQRQDIAGLSFESLLGNLVSEKTLATALKFVKILWSERTNEKLVKSINPLGEVEVHLDVGHGKFDNRYLQFDFHRVRVDGRITHILVSVSDVSARVDLARELQVSQSQAQAQVDTLLGILHIDPVQLSSFLSDSTASMKMINAVLREPAREEGAFRNKLDTLFRQAHSVKGEAAALGLSSIESRAHSFEEDLKKLREKSGLSGNDFLPLVIKLDDFLTHLQSVGELVSRLSHLQMASADTAHSVTAVIVEEPQVTGNTATSMTTMLQQLALRVARENHKDVTLQCQGFEAIPEEYRRLVKDISIQAIRNAIVHGIEPVPTRLAAGKSGEGTIRLAFQTTGETGYKFSVEDDGQGLATERIKEVAMKKGLITAEQAVTLDAKQVYSLLFQSGFSTVDEVTTDAGRGVGMNLMAELMQQVGGRISLATHAGKFTRLSLTLPLSGKRADDTVAA